MRNRLPPLNALRTFETVARHGSIAGAATELHVTPSAVSHQLRALDTALKLPLFAKSRGRMSLTRAGEMLYADTASAFDLLSSTVAKLDQTTSKGDLCVSCVPAFLSYWIAPRLERIRNHLPGVNVRFVSPGIGGRNIPQADVSILYGDGNWPDMWVQLISGLNIFPVISPALAAKVPLRSTKDLANHVLLHSDDGSEWSKWLQSSGVRVRSFRQQSLSDAQVTLEAAIHGQGITLGDDLTARHALDAGRLFAPFDASIPASQSLYLVCVDGARDTPIVASFIAWLFNSISDFKKIK